MNLAVYPFRLDTGKCGSSANGYSLQGSIYPKMLVHLYLGQLCMAVRSNEETSDVTTHLIVSPVWTNSELYRLR